MHYTRSIIAYAPSFLVAATCGSVAFVVLARELGPVHYGEYALASSTITVVAAVLGDWLAQVVLFGSARRRRASRTHAATRWMQSLTILTSPTVLLTGCSILVATMTAYALIVTSGLPTLAAPTLLVVFVAILHRPLSAATRRANRPVVYSIGVSAGAVLSTTVTISLTISRRPLEEIVLALALLYVVPVLCALLAVRHAQDELHDDSPGLDKGMRSSLSFGLPIILTSIGGQALVVADRYILVHFSTIDVVGAYSAAYNVADKGLALLFGPLLFALQPALVRTWRTDVELSKRILSQIMQLFLVVFSLAIAAAALFHGALGRLILGPSFAKESFLIPLVCLGVAAWDLAILRHQVLELRRNTMAISRAVILTGGLNILLNIALVPMIGALGAALATTVAYLAYLGIIERRVRRIYSGWPWPSLKVLMRPLTVGIILLVVAKATATAFQVGDPSAVAMAAAAGSVGVLLELRRRRAMFEAI